MPPSQPSSPKTYVQTLDAGISSSKAVPIVDDQPDRTSEVTNVYYLEPDVLIQQSSSTLDRALSDAARMVDTGEALESILSHPYSLVALYGIQLRAKVLLYQVLGLCIQRMSRSEMLWRILWLKSRKALVVLMMLLRLVQERLVERSKKVRAMGQPTAKPKPGTAIGWEREACQISMTRSDGGS